MTAPPLPKADLESALCAIADMAARGEKAQQKFAPGTAQHTLQQNRLAALAVSAALVKRALAGQAAPAGFTRAALEKARAPIASLAAKCEKARQKLAPGSWQHTMLENNLRALAIAAPLLEHALKETEG